MSGSPSPRIAARRADTSSRTRSGNSALLLSLFRHRSEGLLSTSHLRCAPHRRPTGPLLRLVSRGALAGGASPRWTALSPSLASLHRQRSIARCPVTVRLAECPMLPHMAACPRYDAVQYRDNPVIIIASRDCPRVSRVLERKSAPIS